MKIDHIAIWVRNLDVMKDFYVKYFNGKAGKLYHNPAKHFSSYFISFDEGCKLEIMHRPDIANFHHDKHSFTGITHFSISVGSKDTVNQLTEQLRSDGYVITSEPRTTGDGYYESAIFDPEGNTVEIAE